MSGVKTPEGWTRPMNDEEMRPKAFRTWGAGEIVRYGMKIGSDTSFSVSWQNGVRVNLHGEERAAEIAVTSLATAAMALDAALTALEIERDARARLLAAMPPKEPQRLIGTGGCVREDPKGRGLWLLNRAETGWASFGFRLDGWNDLFRRFDVVIGAPSTDEHGQWWPAEPRQ